jgi:hypothetical protein
VRYAQYYNAKHKRRGHVFGARFCSKIAEGLFAQLETIRYVALNPVKAHICERPEDYPWCGYGSTIGKYDDDRIVDVRAIVALFGSRAAYRRYVEEPDERVRWGQAGARPRQAARATKKTRIRAGVR